MADFGSPVADQIQNPFPQAVSTISGLLGLQQQRAAIQMTQAEAQQQTQTAQQRMGVAGWVRDNMQKYQGPDGLLDMNRVISDKGLANVAGDSWPQVMQSMATVRQTQLTNRQALLNLDQGSLQDFNQDISPLSQDPDVIADNAAGRAKVTQTINNLSTLNPALANVGRIFGPIVEHAPQGQLAFGLKQMLLQANAPAAQASAITPQMVSTGGTLRNVNPLATSSPQSVPMTLAPGINAIQDPLTHQWLVYNQQNPGRTIAVGEGGNFGAAVQQLQGGNNGQAPNNQSAPPNAVGTQPTAQNVNRPSVLGPGQVQNVSLQAASDQNAWQSAIKPANSAYLNKNILNQMETLSHETPTGPGTNYVADLETVIGQYFPGMQGATTDAAKRNLLDKYMEQLAANLTYSNFGNTDSSRDMLLHAIPNAHNMSPPAYQAAAQYIATQMKIAQARGMFASQYFKSHGNSVGYQNAEAQFMQSIDPRIFDYDMLPDSQKSAWINKTFGKNKQALQQFARSYNAIDSRSGFNYNPQQ